MIYFSCHSPYQANTAKRGGFANDHIRFSALAVDQRTREYSRDTDFTVAGVVRAAAIVATS